MHTQKSIRKKPEKPETLDELIMRSKNTPDTLEMLSSYLS